MTTQTDFAKALQVLHDGGVEFIIVGGVAAVLHGLGYTTYDLDVVYSRDRANIQKLVACLDPRTLIQRNSLKTRCVARCTFRGSGARERVGARNKPTREPAGDRALCRATSHSFRFQANEQNERLKLIFTRLHAFIHY